jgi:rhodanese-related sulfurtransferase
MTGAPITSDQLFADARSGLRRLTPSDAYADMARGLRPVDIRSDCQRALDGVIPGSLHVPRNVLEWRLDRTCPYRDPELGHRDAGIALICAEGYQSSLAAATVARSGLADVTDVIGGYSAWRAAGLAVKPASTSPPKP